MLRNCKVSKEDVKTWSFFMFFLSHWTSQSGDIKALGCRSLRGICSLPCCHEFMCEAGGSSVDESKKSRQKDSPPKNNQWFKFCQFELFSWSILGAEGGGSDSGRWGNKKSLPPKPWLTRCWSFFVMEMACIFATSFHDCSIFREECFQL